MRANAIPILLTVFLLGGCQDGIQSETTSGETPVKEVVLENLRSPWSIAFINDEVALIAEKEGSLLKVNLTTKTKVEIAGFPTDLVDDIHSEMRGDNGGIFEILLDPDYATNRLIYVSYAAKNDFGRTTKVIRGALEGDRLVGIETVLTAEPYTANEYHHYGGGMVFGHDGKLYVTIGERLFNEKDQPPLPVAQNVQDARGKIYRLNSDGSIPNDNPNFGDTAVPGLYATGIRAAQGIALHPDTHAIWFTEHGTRQGDEVNRLKAGANYGWPVKTTGSYRDPEYTPPSMDQVVFENPAWYWLHTVAPTGLVFYRGSEFANWDGDLLVAGLSRGSLWRLNFEDDKIVSLEELFVNDRVRSRKVALSPGGDLYILTDTLFESGVDGALIYTGEPSGSLVRIRNAAKGSR